MLAIIEALTVEKHPHVAQKTVVGARGSLAIAPFISQKYPENRDVFFDRMVLLWLCLCFFMNNKGTKNTKERKPR
jgi:hypothetical protein